jgi:hypothetical protein
MIEEGMWSRTVRYGDQIFAARCPKCSRFMKTDEVAKVMVEWSGLKEPNATCKKHSRVRTPFLMWVSDCDEG